MANPISIQDGINSFNTSRGRSRICGPVDRKASIKNWWLMGGIPTANCLAAYDCMQNTLAKCYVNKNNPGTFDATALSSGPELVDSGGIFFYPLRALSLGFSGATKPVSVIANIRPMSLTGGYRTIFGASATGGFGVQFNNTDNLFAAVKQNTIALGVSVTPCPIGTMVVISVTYGSGGDIKIFINGNLDYSGNNNQTFTASTAQAGRQLTNQQGGVFILYHLSAYNIELTPNQVKAVSMAMMALSPQN